MIARKKMLGEQLFPFLLLTPTREMAVLRTAEQMSEQ